MVFLDQLNRLFTYVTLLINNFPISVILLIYLVLLVCFWIILFLYSFCTRLIFLRQISNNELEIYYIYEYIILILLSSTCIRFNNISDHLSDLNCLITVFYEFTTTKQQKQTRKYIYMDKILLVVFKFIPCS